MGFRCEIEFTCVRELLSWMIKEGKSLELLAYTAWTVWNQRNKVRLNLQACPMHHVAEQAAELLAQYKANTEASGTHVRSNGNGGYRWRAPQAGFVKVNFDGAVFDDANKSGVGVVIRDSYGAVLASCSEKILQAYKAELTEALAAWKALSFAHELGFQNVILEGDALHLIQALKSQEQSLCALGLLVEDVKIYSSHFQRVLEQMSLLSDLKLAAQILGLVILIIALVLTLRKFTTNNTDNATQRFPGDNLAGGHGVINSGQDNLQMIAVNVNPV
ncbi:uncharacterized protein LOC136063207 [Quercus suber]|uniref:uncharacterized protein LOC136063207 n=1 Tax=Quercus suber TaxID=58331 RepID=UPI0032DFD195